MSARREGAFYSNPDSLRPPTRTSQFAVCTQTTLGAQGCSIYTDGMAQARETAGKALHRTNWQNLTCQQCLGDTLIHMCSH